MRCAEAENKSRARRLIGVDFRDCIELGSSAGWGVTVGRGTTAYCKRLVLAGDNRNHRCLDT
jgi:hypothetical protein